MSRHVVLLFKREVSDPISGRRVCLSLLKDFFGLPFLQGGARDSSYSSAIDAYQGGFCSSAIVLLWSQTMHSYMVSREDISLGIFFFHKQRRVLSFSFFFQNSTLCTFIITFACSFTCFCQVAKELRTRRCPA